MERSYGWRGGVLCHAATEQEDASTGGGSLTHEALLYGSEEEFLAATVPFIRDGLERDEAIHIATTDRNTGWLRAALGGEASRVTLGASSRCYRHPVRALAAMYRTAHRARRNGRRLRIIGEPWWTARTAPEAKEWIRYESLLNSALDDTDVTLMCAYDTNAIDQDVLTQVARTHPELVECGQLRHSPVYADPVTFNTECNSSPLPELPAPNLWLKFSRAEQLATLRDFVTSHASKVCPDSQSVEPFVQAVDEIATNAIEHGGGSGVLQVWTGHQSLLCEVSDDGTGLRDPLAGQLPRPPGQVGGCGLWLARQFTDLLELHSDRAGTTVRLHLILH